MGSHLHISLSPNQYFRLRNPACLAISQGPFILSLPFHCRTSPTGCEEGFPSQTGRGVPKYPGRPADGERSCKRGGCMATGPSSSDERRPSKLETGLPGEFTALGLQHGMEAKRLPWGVRRVPNAKHCVGDPSTPTAGGSNAINSRRTAALHTRPAESESVRSFLCLSEETGPVPEELGNSDTIFNFRQKWVSCRQDDNHRGISANTPQPRYSRV